MSMKYGIEAEVDSERTTLSKLGRFVDEIRKYGVDEEGDDYSVTYGGDVWISGLLKEQATEVIKVMMLARMDILYVYRYNPETEDVDESVYDSDKDDCTVLEAMAVNDMPDNQMRPEDFDVSEKKN